MSRQRNHACSKQSSVEESFDNFDLPKANFLIGESLISSKFFNDDKFNPILLKAMFYIQTCVKTNQFQRLEGNAFFNVKVPVVISTALCKILKSL